MKNKITATILALISLIAMTTLAIAEEGAFIKNVDKYGHPTGTGGYVIRDGIAWKADKFGHITGEGGFLIRQDGDRILFAKPVDKYGHPK